MTAATFHVTKGKNKLILRVSHDGHPNGVFSDPLFNALKHSKNPSFFMVIKALVNAAKTGDHMALEIWPEEETACSSDYDYRIDLVNRTWKLDGYLKRVF